MDLYIYYRVRSENAAALQGRVESLQQRLEKEYGIVTGLKRRPQEKDGLQTWMEVYFAVPAGFEAALEDAFAAEGFSALIEGPRHTEHFVDVASCA